MNQRFKANISLDSVQIINNAYYEWNFERGLKVINIIKQNFYDEYNIKCSLKPLYYFGIIKIIYLLSKKLKYIFPECINCTKNCKLKENKFIYVVSLFLLIYENIDKIESIRQELLQTHNFFQSFPFFEKISLN